MKTEVVRSAAASVGSGVLGEDQGCPEKRQWESFPQPCGWSLRWENEGLLYPDRNNGHNSEAAPVKR